MRSIARPSLLSLPLTILVLFFFFDTSRAAFPVKANSENFTTKAIQNPASFKENIRTIAHLSYFNNNAYYKGKKSGVFGIVSFTAAILSFVSLIAAAIVLWIALPTTITALFFFSFPRPMYFYLALSVIFSSAAVVCGFLGVKRKYAGLAIIGFILGVILLIGAISILGNI